LTSPTNIDATNLSQQCSERSFEFELGPPRVDDQAISRDVFALHRTAHRFSRRYLRSALSISS
jgi:hypothetical protein